MKARRPGTPEGSQSKELVPRRRTPPSTGTLAATMTATVQLLEVDALGDAGPDVVLLNGTPVTPSHLTPLATRLAARYRTWNVHLPGYGRSRRAFRTISTSRTRWSRKRSARRGSRRCTSSVFRAGHREQGQRARCARRIARARHLDDHRADPGARGATRRGVAHRGERGGTEAGAPRDPPDRAKRRTYVTSRGLRRDGRSHRGAPRAIQLAAVFTSFFRAK
jgi:hypothetical protein